MRYPDDFDGIVAASPAINTTRFAPSLEWPPLVMSWMDHYLPTCKEDAVTEAVMTACNGTADGVKDGLIDPTTCNFDPKSLLGLQTPCGIITALDVAAIEKIWQGPRDQHGFLWYGLVPGASFWQLQGLPYLGVASTASLPTASDPLGLALTAIPFPIGDDFLRYFIHEDPSWTYHQETYDQYVQDFRASATKWGTYFSDDPDLTAFSSRGGKLILSHGLADPVIPPQGTLNYYKRVLDTMGASRVADFARLFLAPNVDHCVGGTGPMPDDPLAAVVRWREQGIAPVTLAASGTNIAGQPITRNLCPFPQKMEYGSGDILAASSFHCTGRPRAVVK